MIVIQQIDHRQEHGYRGDRNAEETAALFGGFLLSALLQHVEIGEPDQSGKDVQRRKQSGELLPAGELVDEQRRKHAEADEVAQRVDLDAEALFIRITLLGLGNGAVEHIADTRRHQAEQRRPVLLPHYLKDAETCQQ